MKNILVAFMAMTILVASAEARRNEGQSRNQNREQHQQSRIKQGVQSGSLTHKEAKKLRKGQKRIDHMQTKAMGDGTVTPEEKLKIEKAQDRQSKLIYKQKHDEQNRKANPNQPVDNGQEPVAPVEAAESNE